MVKTFVFVSIIIIIIFLFIIIFFLLKKSSRIFIKLGQYIAPYEFYNSPRDKWPWPIFQGHRVIQRSNFENAISESRSDRESGI